MTRFALALTLLLLAVHPALAAGGDPLPEPTANGTPGVSPERRYNEGMALIERQDWAGAEIRFRQAIALAPRMPEAWNELGHVLKNERKFDEAVSAYQEALRLRPDYPQALQYLGEAYVQMGKTAEAKAVLARLQVLDEGYAEVLARAITTGSGSGW